MGLLANVGCLTCLLGVYVCSSRAARASLPTGAALAEGLPCRQVKQPELESSRSPPLSCIHRLLPSTAQQTRGWSVLPQKKGFVRPVACCRWNDDGPPREVDVHNLQGAGLKSFSSSPQQQVEGRGPSPGMGPDPEAPPDDAQAGRSPAYFSDDVLDSDDEALPRRYDKELEGAGRQRESMPGSGAAQKSEQGSVAEEATNAANGQSDSKAEPQPAPQMTSPFMRLALAALAAMLWVWRLLPFRLRRLACPRAPPAPEVHASPTLAAFMSEPNYVQAFQHLKKGSTYEMNTGDARFSGCANLTGGGRGTNGVYIWGHAESVEQRTVPACRALLHHPLSNPQAPLRGASRSASIAWPGRSNQWRCISNSHWLCSAAGRSSNPVADIPRWRLEHLVGTGIRKTDLYHIALSGPVAVTEDLSIKRSYERLEFLGDSLLNAIVKDWIFKRWVQ